MVSHKNYNPSTNEGFVMFLTSKLITCLIDGFTLKKKSHLVAQLFNESEHIYWILDLENEVHSRWLCGQVAFKNARVIPGSGDRDSGFFGATPTRRPDKCNACCLYLERHVLEGRGV